jgi:hypothetical protein
MMEEFYQLLNKKYYALAYLWSVKALENRISESIKKILNAYISKDWNTYKMEVRGSYRKIDFDFASEQIDLIQKFDSPHYANIVINNNILVLKPIKLRRARSTIMNFLEEKNNVFLGGDAFQIIGITSINNIKLVIDQFGSDFDAISKYSKVATFIGNLSSQLQMDLSENQIGIIIHENKLYLLKWFQCINESAEGIIEDKGIKIAVEIKEDISLGELIIFKEGDQLEPLLTLDSKFFKENKQYDLMNDHASFIRDILSRIETGINMTESKISVESIEDIDLYVSISLQKIDQIIDAKQKNLLLR